MKDIICIGSATIDVLFKSDDVSVIRNPQDDIEVQELFVCEYGAKMYSDDVHFLYGGGGVNTAMTCASFGFKTGLISCIGNDSFGASIFSQLKQRNIDISSVRVHQKKKTAFAFVIMQKRKRSDRTIFVYRGASNDIELKVFPPSQIPQYIIISSLGKEWENNIRILQKTNAHIAWNPSIYIIEKDAKKLKKYISSLHIMNLNKDEAISLVKSLHPQTPQKRLMSIKFLLKTIYAYKPKLLIITDGPKGVYLYDGKIFYFHKTNKNVKIQDKTGAGDAFFSGFVCAYMKSKDIRKSLFIGQENAQSVLQVIGAQNGILTKKQFLSLLNT